MKKVIEELFAYCAEDVEGEDLMEGLIGFAMDGQWIPLIGADMERVEALRSIAIKIGEQSGKKIVIKKFKLVSTEDV